MPVISIRIPNMLGGVSRVSQSLRSPNEVEAMVNVELDPVRGAQKRPGTQFISGEGARDQLAVGDPTDDMHFFWINRAEGERFVGIINPVASDLADVIQIFDLDGVEQDVQGDGNLNGTPTAMSDAENAALRSYLANGSGDLRRKLVSLTVEDATFLLNRTKVTGLKGTAITYRLGDNSLVRNQSNAQNKTAWSEFTHPPADPATFPAQSVLDAGGNIDEDAIWHARDDDVGQPTGFYWAVSGTQPPWFQRLRTEGALSAIDEDTFPVRLDFDPGGSPPFVLTPILWTDRFAGDSTINSGPSFIGSAISDMVFHQDRLFFLSGEHVVSSRAGDVFNLWINSPILLNDADPIDQQLLGNRTSLIDFGFSFQDALILLTRGSRQVEMRANGPLAPSTAFLSNTTSLLGVEYVRPTSLASRLYFMGERDFSMIVYQYAYDPNSFSNVAEEITTRVQGYIPAEASIITTSEAHQQLFVLSDEETSSVFVYRTVEENGQTIMRAWYKWEFDSGNEILTIQVFDDFLFMLIRRNDLIYLERIPLGTPEQDTDNVSGTVQTMGYNIPIDRKFSIIGVHNAGADTTTWTLPFVDTTIDEVILGPAWDADDPGDPDTPQRLAGMRFTLPELTVVINGNTTEVTVDGQFATNIIGDDPLAFIGRGFNKRVRLSELFFRDQEGIVIQGNLQIMTAVIRHRDTGFYALEVTPTKRSTSVHQFVPIRVGSTDLDSTLLDTFGEFQPRVLARSHGTIIEITNDKPVPSSIVDMEFRAEFVPNTRSPIA